MDPNMEQRLHVVIRIRQKIVWFSGGISGKTGIRCFECCSFFAFLTELLASDGIHLAWHALLFFGGIGQLSPKHHCRVWLMHLAKPSKFVSKEKMKSFEMIFYEAMSVPLAIHT